MLIRLSAPAQDVIEHETKTFWLGSGMSTVWTGQPSPELDNAWTELYNGRSSTVFSYVVRSLYYFAPTDVGNMQITAAEAAHLPNASDPIAIAPEYHFIQFSVFHDLHCLVRD